MFPSEKPCKATTCAGSSRLRFRLGLAAWLALWLVVLAACVHIPETGKSAFILLSPAEEAALGAQAFADLKRQGKVSTNAATNARVQQVANRLIQQVEVPNARWEVVVFEDPIPNAFALPGGKIGVHTGILEITQNDAGLATVLGHELAHVTLRHGAQRFSQQAVLALGGQTLAVAMQRQEQRTTQLALAAFGVGSQLFVALPFSRSQEIEADQIGLRYMARAGYNPQEALAFWRRMAAYAQARGGRPPEWLSTHPADENRLSAIYQMMPLAEMEYRRAIGEG